MNRVIVRLGPFAFEVAGEDERMIATIGDLWRPVGTSEDSRADPIEVQVDGGPPWRVVMGGVPSPTTEDPWKLLTYVRAALDEVIRELSGMPTIHASAVALADRSVLIPGDPGAGKTTVALELVARGGTLLLDDLGLIDPVSARIQGVPRPIGIRGETPMERFADRWQPPSWLGRPTRTYLVPFHAYASTTPSFSPDVIVFPRYEAQAETSSQGVTRAEVMARLGRHIGSLSPRWLPVLSVLASAPGHTLTFGDAESAGERVRELLLKRGSLTE